MFERLDPQDQEYILRLCDDHTYDHVVEILARPRDAGGLALTTSRTSLGRFYTERSRDAIDTQLLAQYTNSLTFNHQAHSATACEGILTLVQNRILSALKSGKALADLDREFRTFERVQRCFFADAKWRKLNVATARDEYFKQIRQFANLPEADFIRTDLKNDPGAGECSPHHFEDDLTELELDFDEARSIPGSQPLSSQRQAAAAENNLKDLKNLSALGQLLTQLQSKTTPNSVPIHSTDPSEATDTTDSNGANATKDSRGSHETRTSRETQASHQSHSSHEPARELTPAAQVPTPPSRPVPPQNPAVASNTPAKNPVTPPNAPSQNPALPSHTPSRISHQIPSKTPVIPHFPPNPTSRNPAFSVSDPASQFSLDSLIQTIPTAPSFQPHAWGATGPVAPTLSTPPRISTSPHSTLPAISTLPPTFTSAPVSTPPLHSHPRPNRRPRPDPRLV